MRQNGRVISVLKLFGVRNWQELQSFCIVQRRKLRGGLACHHYDGSNFTGSQLFDRLKSLR